MLSTGMRRTFFGNAMAMLAVSIAAPRAAAESQPLQIAQTLGAEGTVFAVDKSAGAREAEGDRLLRIRPAR